MPEFTLKLSLSTAGAAWEPLDGAMKLEAASLDELLDELHSHLVTVGRLSPTSGAVAIDSFWRTDGFDDEWVGV